MLKKSLLLLCNGFLLAGCTTQVTPVDFNALPPVTDKAAVTEAPIPTKSEMLKSLSTAVRAALIQFEKTGKAAVIETSQTIQFPFGRMTPSIVCSPLHTCDIAFQLGEKITGVYPGDTARWLFESAVSGEGDGQQMHVVFKPKEENIATNAVVTTNKHTYHLDLYSKKDAIVKTISFYYPDDFEEELKLLQQVKKIHSDEINAQENSEKKFTNQHLDFNYRIETGLFNKNPRWTSVRVFNDGTQVYIQMPVESETTLLPALFVVGKDNQPALVNYRVKKPYYIVDQLFQKAILQSGTGQNQEDITIVYNG